MMKLVTWNVNGIRSLKKDIKNVLNELQSDITCFQETKVIRSQLPENIALIDGYTSYFSYPRKQSGYSGVATYCKDECAPDDAQEGLTGVLGSQTDDILNDYLNGIDDAFEWTDLDSEGRVVITYHLIRFEDERKRLAVINVYCPRVDPDKPERHLFKLQFCQLLEAKAKCLMKKGLFVVILGDLNISCSIIDHCDPGDENEFNSSEARKWLKTFLNSNAHDNDNICMVDAFRHFYPDKQNAYTCWNVKTNARLTNYGTRIDYILISKNMLPILEKCDIMSEYQGSDHCPVYAEFKCSSVRDENCRLPAICTKLWPEFSGRQQTLHSFLKKGQLLADSLIKVSDDKDSSKNKKSNVKSKQKTLTAFFQCKSTVSKAEDTCSQENESNISSSDSGISVDEEIKSVKSTEWKTILKGPPKPPLCSGHGKECVLRTVKKKGPNCGRQFFMCALPAGHASNPDANCNYFKWLTVSKLKKA